MVDLPFRPAPREAMSAYLMWWQTASYITEHWKSRKVRDWLNILILNIETTYMYLYNVANVLLFHALQTYFWVSHGYNKG